MVSRRPIRAEESDVVPAAAFETVVPAAAFEDVIAVAADQHIPDVPGPPTSLSFPLLPDDVPVRSAIDVVAAPAAVMTSKPGPPAIVAVESVRSARLDIAADVVVSWTAVDGVPAQSTAE